MYTYNRPGLSAHQCQELDVNLTHLSLRHVGRCVGWQQFFANSAGWAEIRKEGIFYDANTKHIVSRDWSTPLLLLALFDCQCRRQDDRWYQALSFRHSITLPPRRQHRISNSIAQVPVPLLRIFCRSEELQSKAIRIYESRKCSKQDRNFYSHTKIQ